LAVELTSVIMLIHGFIVRFDLQPGAKPKVGSGNRDETIMGLLQNLSLEGLGPKWIRPLPPRLPVQDGEVDPSQSVFVTSWGLSLFLLTLLSCLQLVWLNPDNNHELLWDYGMCADTSRGAAVRDLIAKALKGPLVPAQQEVLCCFIEMCLRCSVSFVSLSFVCVP